MARRWLGDGPNYAIDWGGRPWELRLDDARPGLHADGIGALLALEGLSQAGRFDPGAFGPSALVSYERRWDRVEATYTPADWGGITVRAAWRPTLDEGIDLEVQLSARSVGELSGVEVCVSSAFGSFPPAGSPRIVVPRDTPSAALSYDGRETDLARLSTTYADDEPALWLAPKSGVEGWTYLEMVHPDDASRRILEGTLPFRAIRYGLFGYDLERGVVLRARLRGAWLTKDRAHRESVSLYEQFLAEPPPLST